MSDTIKTDHADLLNALVSMRRNPIYALRGGVLREAELLIARYERQIRDLRAAIAAKDAPALEAVPDAEFERLLTEFGNLQFDCGAWDDDDVNHTAPTYEALVQKSRAARAALRLAASCPQPAKQEAAPLPAAWPEDPTSQMLNAGTNAISFNMTIVNKISIVKAVYRAVLATKQSPAAPLDKEST